MYPKRRYRGYELNSRWTLNELLTCEIFQLEENQSMPTFQLINIFELEHLKIIHFRHLIEKMCTWSLWFSIKHYKFIGKSYRFDKYDWQWKEINWRFEKTFSSEKIKEYYEFNTDYFLKRFGSNNNVF